MNTNFFDIYIVGVGGQGVLTIADIFTHTAFEHDVPVNYFPTKGMAQRGGFVKAQLRIGREGTGPDIPEGGADLIISMEISETLKALKYLKPGGEAFVYENRWEPTDVMLGTAPYPALAAVAEETAKAGGVLHVLRASSLPEYQGKPVRDNIYILGALMRHTALKKIFTEEEIAKSIREKWPKGAETNLYAFAEGLKANVRA